MRRFGGDFETRFKKMREKEREELTGFYVMYSIEGGLHIRDLSCRTWFILLTIKGGHYLTSFVAGEHR